MKSKVELALEFNGLNSSFWTEGQFDILGQLKDSKIGIFDKVIDD